MCVSKKITVTLELSKEENFAVAQLLLNMKAEKLSEAPKIKTLDDGGEPTNPGKPGKP